MNKNFLSKKSWHTGTIKNVEKVWKAEQRAYAEDKATKQLKRELEEERQIEELKKLHEDQTGHKRAERVDWLYQEPVLSEPSETEREAYLMGKVFQTPSSTEDVKKLEEKPGSLWLNAPRSTAYDKSTKVREDPLFSIQLEKQKQIMHIKKNPVKMEQLKQQVLLKKLKKDLKKGKKSKKRSRDSEATLELNSKRRKTSADPEPSSPPSRVGISRTERHSTQVESISHRRRQSIGRRLSPEQKQKRLAEMEADANRHYDQKIQEIKTRHLKDKVEDMVNKQRTDGMDRHLNPRFIDSMSKSVYNDKSTSSVEDRVKRNINSVQRRNLDERGLK
eukprot:TRINITY_DN3772_c0_g1_i1.p1 TRINITY_DN3772_c0_g1~~TRINITY_DN3772_c0_g1_i1.p1  ORF type:complete len:371 (+),score=104.32 TRINITY_DN3772_c0_g1_i1:116-1114(+)